MSPARIATREEWLAARMALLAEEKRVTRQLDALSAQRRALPWVKVEKAYVFEGPDGKRSLADLFQGRSQLLVQHFMFAPEDDEGCPGCSHSADQVDGARPHFEACDLSFAAVSRAPWEKLAAFRERMGWGFVWVSSGESDFNYDFGVSFTPEQIAAGSVGYNFGTSAGADAEMPGVSVFAKDEAGQVYHTYSTYARGLDILLATHHYLDLTPKGRNEYDEDGNGRLRHHDRYGAEGGACCR